MCRGCKWQLAYTRITTADMQSTRGRHAHLVSRWRMMPVHAYTRQNAHLLRCLAIDGSGAVMSAGQLSDALVRRRRIVCIAHGGMMRRPAQDVTVTRQTDDRSLATPATYSHSRWHLLPPPLPPDRFLTIQCMVRIITRTTILAHYTVCWHHIVICPSVCDTALWRSWSVYIVGWKLHRCFPIGRHLLFIFSDTDICCRMYSSQRKTRTSKFLRLE